MILKFVTKILDSKYFFFSFVPLMGAVAIFAIFFTLSQNFSIVHTGHSIKEGKLEFYKSADIFLDMSNSDSSIEPLKTIFNSIDREKHGTMFKYGFINLLEDYYRYKFDSLKKNVTKSNNTIFILKCIKEEIKQKPFTQLKDEQRRVLTNLDKAIENDDSALAKLNLLELNDILRIENENMRKLEFQNKWSIPIAIVGAILTLIFGIMAVVKKSTNIGNTKRIVDNL